MKHKTYNPREAMIVWGYIHDGPSNEYPVDLSVTTYRKRAKDWKETVMPDEQMPQFDLVPRNKAAVKELALLRKARRTEAADGN